MVQPLLPDSASLAAWRATPKLFEQGAGKSHLVALTFDAGSDANAVPLILKTLAEHHVHATFFLTGKFCEHFPTECRAIADAGMEIGNHSYSHPHFTKLTAAQIDQQLAKAEAAIRKACGRGAKPLFRFPYGDCDRRTRRIVAQAGYQGIAWTLDSLDSVGKPKPAPFVIRRIDSKVKPGFVTLMHVSCVQSARALPQIFDYLDKHDERVAPVSSLLVSSLPPAKSTVAAQAGVVDRLP